MSTNLEFLLREHRELKQSIYELQRHLDSVNESIASLCDSSEEGSKTLKSDTLKATVTHKLNRRLDKKAFNKWTEQGHTFPDGYELVVPDVKLDNATMKKVEKEHPEWLHEISKFVIVSDAKTAVKVEEV